MRFYLDIEDVSGNRLGSGPIASVSRWQSTAKMDQAGEFAFAMAASDEQAAIVAETRIARRSTGTLLAVAASGAFFAGMDISPVSIPHTGIRVDGVVEPVGHKLAAWLERLRGKARAA